METREVVTAFLSLGGKVLILRRSDRVGTYGGKWAGISGYLEPGDPSPLERARTEVREEAGVENARLLKEGKPFEVIDEGLGRRWIVHPFLFEVDEGRVRLDWESVEARWIEPDRLREFDHVPGLDLSLKAVLS
ncbi:MAG: NUDIX domain-containing protein [Nitrospinota bacterium]